MAKTRIGKHCLNPRPFSKEEKTNNIKKKQGSPVLSGSGLALVVDLMGIYISVSKGKPCTRSKYLNQIFTCSN